MSFGWSATTWALVASAAATTYSAYATNEAGNRQAASQREQLKQAKYVSDLQDQANNKASAKTPNLTDLLSANGRGASNGVGSTMLTGPSGVANNALTLGKSTLLGGG